MSKTLYIKQFYNITTPTIFCVGANGQKTYWLNRKEFPYGSAQWAKRNILEAFQMYLGENSERFFLQSETDMKKEQTSYNQKLAYRTPELEYAVNVLGGYFVAKSKAKGKKDIGDNNKQFKKEAEFQVSAFSPVGDNCEVIKDLVTIGSGREYEHSILHNGKEYSWTEFKNEFPEISEKYGMPPNQKFVGETKRAVGVFEHWVAIPLDTFLRVNKEDVYSTSYEKAIENGWVENEHNGRLYITPPKEVAEQWIDALSKAIMNWRGLANQSINFNPMNRVATIIGDDAMEINNRIVEVDGKFMVGENGVNTGLYLSPNFINLAQNGGELIDIMNSASHIYAEQKINEVLKNALIG